jgi:hypothetical protein
VLSRTVPPSETVVERLWAAEAPVTPIAKERNNAQIRRDAAMRPAFVAQHITYHYDCGIDRYATGATVVDALGASGRRGVLAGPGRSRAEFRMKVKIRVKIFTERALASGSCT